jgi:hypothetical protein
MKDVRTVLRHMRIIYNTIVKEIDSNFTYKDFKETIKGNLKYFKGFYSYHPNPLYVGNEIYRQYLCNQKALLILKQKLSQLFDEKFEESKGQHEFKERELNLKIKECDERSKKLKNR